MPQMQASLTSIFSLEIDPREAAMRETEDAIGVVLTSSEAVELSPQNAYIRRCIALEEAIWLAADVLVGRESDLAMPGVRAQEAI